MDLVGPVGLVGLVELESLVDLVGFFGSGGSRWFGGSVRSCLMSLLGLVGLVFSGMQKRANTKNIVTRSDEELGNGVGDGGTESWLAPLSPSSL